MAINYPDGIDVFTEPTLPEYTSLSQAGPDGRAHVAHHRDLGDAVQALETYAAKRGHDHSGNSSDTSSGSKLSWANTHEASAPPTSLGAAEGYADTNNGDLAIHHTLGDGEFQAAKGNHNHFYNNLIGIPWQTCTSNSYPANPTPGMLVYETDKNRIRVWGNFNQNQLTTGLNATENFNQGTNNLNLGTNRWQQTYYATNLPVPEIFTTSPPAPWTTEETAQGKMAIPDGQTASWIDAGNFTEQCVARRIYPADANTETDNQVLVFKTGSTVIENGESNPLLRVEGATNDFYLRMSADSQSYWRFRMGFDYVKVFATTTGRDGEFFLGQLTKIITNLANMEWRIELQDRTLRFYRLGEFLGAVSDSRALTSMGANFRGWGIGMQAGYRVFGQTTPANLDWVQIFDLAYYSSVNRWTLLPGASIPSCRLRQNTTQQLSHLGTILQWQQVLEDNFGFFNSGAPSQIVITEPGLYQVDLAVQWDPDIAPDIAIVVLLLNGQETDVREQRWVRGSDNTPGFSQTVSLSAKIRVAKNDAISVKCRHGAQTTWLDRISSYFNSTSKIASRIDVTYIAP